MVKKKLKFKAKRGRPRMARPSHSYTPAQWKQHQSVPDTEKALRALKKMGLSDLLEYSDEELSRSYHGSPPSCFAKGDIDTLPECEECKTLDRVSKVVGFFKPDGEDLTENCFGLYVCCWILCWVRALQKL